MLNNTGTMRVPFFIDLISHVQVPPGGKNLYKRNFLRDFVDLNIAMWTSNNALTPDPEKESDGLTSGPAVDLSNDNKSSSRNGLCS